MTVFDYQTLSVKRDPDGVTAVRLNRPARKNALSAAMIMELTELAGRLGADEKTRVVTLSGAGDVFCAGGDLQWMQAQMKASRAARIAEARKLAHMLKALNALPRPLLGQVHGGAYGGGLGLLCVCDYVAASSETKFGLTETRLGLIPATISPYVVARLGEGMARRIFMSGRVFGAEEAKAIGLVAEVVEPAGLQAAIERQIRPCLAAAPGAVSAAKALALSFAPAVSERHIDDSITRLADAWESPEAAEGIDAFFRRRPANWVKQRSVASD